jgi:hypothetical protein
MSPRPEPRWLLTVEAAFEITGRGTAILPGVPAESRWPTSLRLELRRSDGTKREVIGHVSLEHVLRWPPDRSEHVWTLLLETTKAEVPPGTVVFEVAAPDPG